MHFATVAIEKVHTLEALGAKVERVRPASIIDERQFVNLARSRALAFGQTVLTSLPDVVDSLEGGEEDKGDSGLGISASSSAYGGKGRVGETYGETTEDAVDLKREADLVVSDRGDGGESWKTGLDARGL